MGGASDRGLCFCYLFQILPCQILCPKTPYFFSLSCGCSSFHALVLLTAGTGVHMKMCYGRTEKNKQNHDLSSAYLVTVFTHDQSLPMVPLLLTPVRSFPCLCLSEIVFPLHQIRRGLLQLCCSDQWSHH